LTVGVFAFSETDSWLRRRNPSAKLAAHLVVTLLVTLVFDPLTPLAFLAVAFLAGRILAAIPIRRLAAAPTAYGLSEHLRLWRRPPSCARLLPRVGGGCGRKCTWGAARVTPWHRQAVGGCERSSGASMSSTDQSPETSG
jgi:hypothetical protein